MQRAILAVVSCAGLLGALPTIGEAGGYPLPSDRQLETMYRSYVGSTYNPQYGHSTGYAGRANFYGNSAPYGGRIRFAPGFGYGSIYGNSGHPGFGHYSGPAWSHPAAWGR